jgi:ABC-2 type transport system permease protein
MRGLLAIYRREMSSYFVSPVAYIVIGFFLLIAGFFFYNILSAIIEQQMMMAMQAQRMGGPPDMDVPSLVLRNFMGIMSTFSLFMVPMLTMGVYAEERRRGTMEMLMTSPLTEWQIVLGKFFASLTLYMIMIGPTIIFMLIMAAYSDPGMPWRVMWAGYLGTLLLGAVFIAIGSFISSLTESQIVAAVVTFVVFLLLWVIDFGVRGSSSTFSSILQYLSIIRHYDDFSRGIIDTTGLVYYVSLAGLGVFLTLRALDSMRWRRA